MMLTKPRPTEETKEAPSVQKPESSKPKSSTDAVEDLERRLALLGGASSSTLPPPEVSAGVDLQDAPLLAAKAPPISHAAPPVEAVGVGVPLKGGKSALLARIMAAQERAKFAGQKQASEMDQHPVTSEQVMKDPPPPDFDDAFLPIPTTKIQETAPPPSFDMFAMQQMQMLPPPSLSDPAVVPSAPAFDLLDVSQPASTLPTQSSSFGGFEQLMSPPPPTALSPEEVIIMGMEGLSADERKALLDEQRTIMDQIEKEKAANEAAIAEAAADDFDQRSAPAVAQIAGGGATKARMPVTTSGKQKPGSRKVDLGGGNEVALHGPEKTRSAIKDGTAILVQCMNCESWMQVTAHATLMYCPVCAVVSPVEVQSAVCTREEALQLTMDRRMAEQMQKEEYEAVNREEVAGGPAAAATTKIAEEEASWWDTVSNMFSIKSETLQPTPQIQRPLLRGEVGVSLPPGASKSAGGLSPTRNDIQSIDFTDSNDERDGLLGNGGGGRARVAERKPMFSCVVDSVANAGTYLGSALTTHTLSEDDEGNVHGVDASSLLAVSTVSRETDYKPL